jgi:hypothetical protein
VFGQGRIEGWLSCLEGSRRMCLLIGCSSTSNRASAQLHTSPQSQARVALNAAQQQHVPVASFFLAAALPAGGSQIFQKRRVSSLPAAELHTVVASGDSAVCSTRPSCPNSSVTRTIDGYFHTMSWLCWKPCALTSSFSVCDHTMLVTWLLVSIECTSAPVPVL